MKVTYTKKNGEKVEQKFDTEEEGKKLKEKLKAEGVTDAKWEWQKQKILLKNAKSLQA